MTPFCFLESEVDRVKVAETGLVVRDTPVVVVTFVAVELDGAMTDIGRVDGLTGRRLGEPLREASVPDLATFSAGGGIVGFRRERVRWSEDMAVVWGVMMAASCQGWLLSTVSVTGTESMWFFPVAGAPATTH